MGALFNGETVIVSSAVPMLLSAPLSVTVNSTLRGSVDGKRVPVSVYVTAWSAEVKTDGAMLTPVKVRVPVAALKALGGDQAAGRIVVREDVLALDVVLGDLHRRAEDVPGVGDGQTLVDRLRRLALHVGQAGRRGCDHRARVGRHVPHLEGTDDGVPFWGFPSLTVTVMTAESPGLAVPGELSVNCAVP